MRFAGALILNKIIDDLKSKLPFLKKKEEEIDAQSDEKTGLTEITDLNSVDEDVSSEEEASEDKSLINKLKAKLASLQKKKKSSSDDEESDDDDESEESDEEEKKKKRSKIIRIAIVGALVVFLASDYIFPPEDKEVPEEAPVQESPSRRNKKKTEEAPVEPAAPVETTETVPAEEPSTTPTTDQATDDLPDVSAGSDIIPTEETPTTTYTPDDSPVDITSDDSVDSIPSNPTSDDSIYGEDSSVGDVSSPDLGIGTSSDDLTDQILQDLEKQAGPVEEKKTVTKYVAPPDYDYIGRGLVYNCKGRHWACVDAPSYKVCEDNASSTKFLGKPVECYPFNVYETTRGCEITQNRMVSSNAKTKFCNE